MGVDQHWDRGFDHVAADAGALALPGVAALHPLGYPIGPIWIMDHLWFNMFLAWLIKLLVLKYGGLGFYRKTRPFFLGMILGHIVPGGFFLLVDHFTGMVGNVIFWG